MSASDVVGPSQHPPPSIDIRITLPEFDLAMGVARLRIMASAMLKLDHATTYDRTMIKRLEEEVVGACGEIAVGKWIGGWFVPSVNTFHRVPDCMHNIEVRSTARLDGKLIVRNNDKDDRRFVLALVTGEMVSLAGWVLGADAKRKEWAMNPNGNRDAWFVPQSALNPMTSLL